VFVSAAVPWAADYDLTWLVPGQFLHLS